MQYLVAHRLPVSQIIVEGLKAPLRHPVGLLISSALWATAAFLFDYEVSLHRRWIQSADGEMEWRYSFSWYGGILYALQTYAFASFFISWTRGVHSKATAAGEFRLVRFERRVWWLFRDCFKLCLRIAVIGIPVTLLLFVLGSISQFVSGLLILLGSIWLCCRLSVFATAIAIGEEPDSIVDAIEPTKGNAARIFIAMLPLFVLVTALKGLVSGMLASLDQGSFSFHFSFSSAWYDANPGDAVSVWMVGVETLFDCLFYAWAFATLTEIYRCLTPKRATDESVVGVF